MDVCNIYCHFVTFPFGILGQVWYLIVSIPDHCCFFLTLKIYNRLNEQKLNRHVYSVHVLYFVHSTRLYIFTNMKDVQ